MSVLVCALSPTQLLSRPHPDAAERSGCRSTLCKLSKNENSEIAVNFIAIFCILLLRRSSSICVSRAFFSPRSSNVSTSCFFLTSIGSRFLVTLLLIDRFVWVVSGGTSHPSLPSSPWRAPLYSLFSSHFLIFFLFL